MHEQRTLWAVTSGVLCAACSPLAADQVRVRFVERVGNVDVVLPGNQIGFDVFPRRIRVQVAVFDDAQGEAPAGGVVGWNGSLRLTRWIGSRTPGRLPLFRSVKGANGEPAADPFLQIDGIEATIGSHVLVWACEGSMPIPLPVPVIRGRNQYVSVYEVTLRPVTWCAFGQAFMDLTGEVLTASSWELAGEPRPPVCTDPPVPGEAVYEPEGVIARPVSGTLTLTVGAPGFPAPECPPDWNRDDTLNSQDFFDFLADFFGGIGDYTCDGVLNSADFFAYLADYFTGCP